MRLAFWRAGRDKARVQRAIAKPAPATYQPATAPSSGDLDMRALGEALARKRGWIVVPTVLAAVLSITAVNLVTPRYKSEARILIDGRENVFLRPNGERVEERNALDPEAVTSQVQLLLSRDLASEIIKIESNSLGLRRYAVSETLPAVRSALVYRARRFDYRTDTANIPRGWIGREDISCRLRGSSAERICRSRRRAERGGDCGDAGGGAAPGP